MRLAGVSVPCRWPLFITRMVLSWKHRILHLLLLGAYASRSEIPFYDYISDDLKPTIIPLLQERFRDGRYTLKQKEAYTRSFLLRHNIIVPDEDGTMPSPLKPIPDREYYGPVVTLAPGEYYYEKEEEVVETFDDMPIDRFLRESMGADELEALWNNRMGSTFNQIPEDDEEYIEPYHPNDNEDPFSLPDDKFLGFLVGKRFMTNVCRQILAPNPWGNVSADRYVQCLTNVALSGVPMIFDRAMLSARKRLDHCPRLHDLLFTLLREDVDPNYLKVFLQECHDDTILLDLANLLNNNNTGRHQMIIDMCATRLPKDVVARLGASCTIPAILQSVWDTNRPELLNTELLNHLGEESHEQIARFENPDVQIMCMFSKEGPAISMSDYLEVPQLTKRFQRLAKQSEMQRRFCLIHLDKKTSMVTIMKSPNTRGPVFLAYRPSTACLDEYVIDTTLFRQFFQNEQTVTNTAAEPQLLSAQVQLCPGMVIVGFPQSILMDEPTEPSTYLPNVLNGPIKIQNPWNVKCLLKRNITYAASVLKRMALVIGIVPQ